MGTRSAHAPATIAMSPSPSVTHARGEAVRLVGSAVLTRAKSSHEVVGRRGRDPAGEGGRRRPRDRRRRCLLLYERWYRRRYRYQHDLLRRRREELLRSRRGLHRRGEGVGDLRGHRRRDRVLLVGRREGHESGRKGRRRRRRQGRLHRRRYQHWWAGGQPSLAGSRMVRRWKGGPGAGGCRKGVGQRRCEGGG